MEVIIIMTECGDNREKGANPMEIAVKLKRKDQEMLLDMDNYIKRLKSQPKSEASVCAVKALKRTGVLTQSGKSKKKIVSWE